MPPAENFGEEEAVSGPVENSPCEVEGPDGMPYRGVWKKSTSDGWYCEPSKGN